MTYTNKERLEKKTGTAGQGRFHYLQSLVTEFQDTHRKGILTINLINIIS